MGFKTLCMKVLAGAWVLVEFLRILLRTVSRNTE